MTASAPSRKLTLGDIADIRAYERVRDAFRAEMIELRRRRRVAVGTVVAVAFENRDTIRFQIQEMARVEKIATDEGVQQELDAYNPLIPEVGQLRATLFIELTSDVAMREWLPKLVGIERSVLLRLPNGDEVRGAVEALHAAQLTREHVTAAVHYITFELTPDQVEAFGAGTVLAIDHPSYQEETELSSTTVSELADDLGGRGARRTVTQS
jgi:sulfur transfer complex TusBCD TusB component (DsrH family)